ncbi:MAG: peptidase S10, partial [Anaerolineaceae bacterium]|nr:peptidase S10 [Anaerolineaceae bacterium]
MEKKASDTQEDKDSKPVTPEEKTTITKHTVKVGGKELKYTVTAGTIILKKEDEEKGVEPKASVFYIAYTLDDVDEPSKRPITFSFNGGPGSSSVWMHLGLLGPKRVKTDENGFPFPPPYKLIKNEYTLLDKTDLVFIDPVSTGYSRSVPGEKAEQFHGVKEDIESVGDFIHQYVTRTKRWISPKFLIGESYGTTRAAGLSTYIQDRHGMYFNGLMLISSILNFGTARFDPGNDLPHILFLPTYSATAWFHKKLAPTLQENLRQTLDQVEEFASGEYLLALHKGSKITPEDKEEIATKLAHFTGLSKDYV